MENNGNDHRATSIFPRVEQNFRVGQKVIYEGKAAQLVRVKPFLVIRTGDRAVCGALHKILHVHGDASQ